MIGAITAGLFSTPVAPVTNSYESIATVTVGSGGQSTISFTSIPSTYKHLQIRGIGKTSRVTYSAGAMVQFNSDTAANYANHELFGDGSAAYSNGSASVSSIRVDAANATISSANVFGLAVIDILNYSSTTMYKTLRALSGNDTNGAGTMAFNSGLWQNTAAINSILLFPEVGTFQQYSSFALYGIKG